eukprot:16448231-Heterocapsa_arctica.AAC.1
MPIFAVQNTLVMYTCACTPVGPPYLARRMRARLAAGLVACSASWLPGRLLAWLPRCALTDACRPAGRSGCLPA